LETVSIHTMISSTYKPNTHVQVERNPLAVVYKSAHHNPEVNVTIEFYNFEFSTSWYSHLNSLWYQLL